MTKSVWLVSACVLTLISTSALAQQTDVPPSEPVEPAAVPAEAVDEGVIIVTATQRAEALSDVPVAVSAYGGEQLQNSGITDIRALNQLAPSLSVSGATSEVNFVARIRGIGTVGENPGLESSVGLFVDGVYRSRTGVGLTELGEIERIEVLRGPQGTLFGRNTSAGLINIITAKPRFEIGGYASASYGNFDYWRLDGGVTGPIAGDTVAARIDGVWQKRDGFIEDIISGRTINDRDRWLVRGQILAEPNDDISIRIIGDYAERDEECCGAVNLSPNRNLSRDASGNVVISPNTLLPLLTALGADIPTGDPFVFKQSITPGVDYGSDVKDWGLSGEVNWDFGAAKLTSITAYRDYDNIQGQDADFNNLDILRRDHLERQFKTFTQELRFQGTAFDDRLDWLVGGYYAHEKLDVSDDLKFGDDYERYANCLLFASVLPSAVNPLDPSCVNVPLVQAAAAASGSPLLAALVANPARPGFGSVAAVLGQPTLPFSGTGVVRNAFDQKSRNFAFFTHNVFDIIPDTLSLTLGARYTNEKKELTGTFDTNNSLCSLIVNSPLQALAALPCVINDTAPAAFTSADPGSSRKESEWTGTAVLSWKMTPDVLLYGSYSKGYKAGGYNLDTAALDRACNATFDPACAARLALPANQPGNGRPELADLQFEPEKVDAYEIGVKWDGPNIDINAALFYQTFKNFQLNTFNGVNFEVTNIEGCKDDLGGGDVDADPTTGACDPGRTRAGVISKGAELEIFTYPAPDLSVSGGITYLDAHYRNNLTGTDGRPLAPTLFQLPGRPTFSSDFSATGAIAWTPPVVGTDLSTLFYLDFRYQSDQNTGSDIDLEKEQDGYVLFNGRIGLYGPDKRWGIELWGQNLFDKKYQQVAADAPLQGSGTFRGVQTGVQASANQLYIAFPGEPRTYGVTLRTKF
jgi:outer membrane receptor protein involved in Fe transport